MDNKHRKDAQHIQRKTIQNHNEIQPHPCQNGSLKKKSLQVSNVGESVEGALDASVGVDVGSATVENSAEVPQRKKDRVNI